MYDILGTVYCTVAVIVVMVVCVSDMRFDICVWFVDVVAATEKCSLLSIRQKASLRYSLVASYLPAFTTCATRGTGSTSSSFR